MTSLSLSKKRNFYFLYTLLFLVCAALCFWQFYLNGKSFVWKIDGLYQHYNSFIYLGTYVRDFFREFLQDLLNEYSEEYDNKLLEFWKTEKFVTEEKRSANPMLNCCPIELTENGKEEEVFLGHANTAVYFKKLQDILNKMKEKNQNQNLQMI